MARITHANGKWTIANRSYMVETWTAKSAERIGQMMDRGAHPQAVAAFIDPPKKVA